MRLERDEEIAIVGMGCRFPGGASNPEAYWDILKNGVDATVDVPPERWSLRRFYDPDNATAGKILTRRGGYLRESIRAFDAAFFGISPREAAPMDPQQRLLLEVAWEAFEDAGIVPDRLRGSKTGVYVGGFTNDNLLHQLNALNREAISSHTAVSATLVMLSNRLSYVFDLKGPSMTVDTACSSSLVALHLAVQALRRGDCDLALAGGVSLMFRPAYSVAMSKGGFLSPDGRCKSFDASGDGYGRGEGAGIIILKPLSTALRDGDPIHAVVVETGVNQDGRTDGITLPNRESQVALIREVYARAGVAPDQVGYVEAHGTGTKAGDATELRSLSEAIARDRSPSHGPLLVGSAKSNIGHLEAAAGVAGVIKTTLALRHRKLPPSLHFKSPPEAVDLEDLGLEVATKLRPWPEGPGGRLASVNSFGYGGTNAHVVLREAPPPRRVAPTEPARLLLIPVSARSDRSLTRQFMRLHQVLGADPGIPVADLGYTLARRRSHLGHRAAIVARTTDDVRRHLRQFSDTGEVSGGFVQAATDRFRGSLAFVYTGMGAQSWGMGRGLIEAEPLAAAALDRCDAIWRDLSGWSLRELFARSDGQPMREPKFAQPANFALQVMLTETARGYGLRPSAVVGHSAGEMAAAWAAGSLSLEDALRVTWHRSRLQQTCDGPGRMLAVGLSEIELDADLVRDLDIAAVNGPGTVTLAGDAARIEEAARLLDARSVFNKVLPVHIAYHSRHMDGLETRFLESLDGLAPRTPDLPLFSTVTGGPVEGAGQDAGYWWRNLRRRVEFLRAAEAMIGAGHTLFLEIGPHPALASSLLDCLRTAGKPGVCLPSLRRGQEEAAQFAESMARLYVQGVDFDWERPYPDGNLVPLLSYPWDREDLWVETETSKADRLGNHEHPFLGRRVNEATPGWEGDFSRSAHPYLFDHRVQGEPVFPAAGYVELALVARPDKARSSAVENLEIHGSLATFSTPVVRVQLDGTGGAFGIHCRENKPDAPWSRVATGTLTATPVPPLRSQVDPAALRRRCADRLDPEAFYADVARLGMEYGPAFRCIREGWTGAGEALVRLGLGDDEGRTAADYFIHPAILDGALQAVLALRLAGRPDGGHAVALPVGIDQLRFHAKTGSAAWCHVTVAGERIDLVLFDDGGTVLVELFGLRVRPVELRHPDARTQSELLYTTAWPSRRPAPRDLPRATRWLVFKDSTGVAAALRDMGARSRMLFDIVEPGEGFARTADGGFEIARGSRADMARLLHEAGVETLDGILYLWALDLTDSMTGPDDRIVGRADMLDVLHLTCTLSGMDLPRMPPVTVCTAGTQIVRHGDKAEGAPGQSALWSALRAARLELPNLRFKLVDLATRLPFAAATNLTAELRTPADEPEVAFRGTDRAVGRVARLGPERYRDHLAVPGANFAFGVFDRGGVRKRCFVETGRRSPAAHEVEIAVGSVGLGEAHRPVLRGLTPLAVPVLDLQCAGLISAVGDGVEGLAAGRRALAFAERAPIGAYLTLPADLVLPCPNDLPADDGGALFDWLLAQYALFGVASLKRDHWVLIQDACSGPGMAALRLALRAGAKVIATADTDRRRDQLRSHGCTHVAASETLAFRDLALQATAGRGVDVVLSPLTGELRVAGLDCIRAGGIYLDHAPMTPDSAETIPIRFAERGIRFTRLSLARAVRQAPQDVRAALDSVAAYLRSPNFEPMPVTIVSALSVEDAFTACARHAHEGRLAVAIADRAVPVLRQQPRPVVAPDAGYLVTGGFGGIGLETLRWLAARGAGSLAVISRSGPSSEEARELLRNLGEGGVRVVFEQADVADPDRLAAALARLKPQMPPIRGVIHCAGVLADAAIESMDASMLDRVLSAKALGALNLHRAFAGEDLRFFVCYGSIAGSWGNAGQYNYAGANGFLHGLVLHRRARGLAATCVNWGPVADAGMAVRDGRTADRLARAGLRPLPMASVFGILEEALAENWGSFDAADIDWPLWARQANDRERARLADVLPAGQTAAGRSAEAFRSGVLGLAPRERRAVVFDLMVEIVAAVLNIPKSRINPTSSLGDLGTDSLMAAEISAGVFDRTGIRLRMLYLTRGPTLVDMAERVEEGILAQDRAS
ncbi:type I polyketide synthase [Azospirillum sp. TSO22-1]|uniref:type I polyketide synthase n=1 Tax=Azospirillum sp. TSO22-1 TaxID=716789 RepID=UPI000D61F9A6|nr:type I polyketide synthase [Azospirillum sp. TSO22-1]PWC40156.1 hypothetical protein TSO221_25605 [Azospirillum sp. TSO22-1]